MLKQNQKDRCPVLKPFRVAVVLVMFGPGAAFAQADCEDWNTKAFFEAATARDVQACLDGGADIGARSQAEITPLHYAAAWNGSPKIVVALLDAGADIGAQNHIKNTPLHVVAEYGTPQVFIALLNAGADIEAQNNLE